MPVLNEACEVTRRLDALQRLRNLGHEVIVVDGGSSDDTAQRAMALADVVVKSSPGRAHQMNVGARRARRPVLLFLHIDTQLPPTAARAINNALEQGHWGRFDVQLSGGSMSLRIVEKCMSWRSRWTGIATGDQAIFVLAHVFRTVGEYPEISLMEDIALSKRLLSVGSPMCLRERVTTSSRRWDSGGIVRTILLMWSLRLAYWFGVPPSVLAKFYRARRP